MKNNRFKELRKLSIQKRLEKELSLIDSRFSHSNITDVGVDYHELVKVAETHIISKIIADGSYVDNVDNIISSFNILVKKYIEQNGDSDFRIIIPFDDYHFELSTNLSLIIANYEKIIDSFFKIDNRIIEEILIYKEKERAGLCLFREEHRYFIAIW